MAVGDAVYSGFRNFVRGSRPITYKALLPPKEVLNQRHLIHISAMIVALIVQLFFWLETIVNSPILPGDWSQFSTTFEVDIIYSSLALGMIAALPLYSKRKQAELVIQPDGLYGFAIGYAIFALAWTFLMVLVLWLQGNGVVPGTTDDTLKLQELVEFVAMVSVGEELFFRVAVSAYWGGLASSVIFGLFHLWAYSSAPGALAPGNEWNLVKNLVEAMFFGAVFWFIYFKWGVGAAMGSHAGFDLVSSGAIGLDTTWLSHFGLFPI